MQHLGKENVDLAAERRRATIDIEKMKLFMGSQMCGSVETYQRLIAISESLEHLNEYVDCYATRTHHASPMQMNF